MPTLGEELKRRREERQIALTDISEATRIGTRFLKAIEMDNYGVLPGGIFTRSFIRAFAKQVGMDEDEAIALYQQQVAGVSAEAAPQQRGESIAPPVVEPTRPAARRPEPLTYVQSGPRVNWTTIVIGGGITIFLIVIALAVIQKLKSPSQESAPPRGTVTANSNAATANSNAAATANANTAPGAAETASSTTPTPAVTQGEPLVVKLEATIDNCSLQYWIDDAPKPTSVLIKKGEAQSLPPAQSQVRLNIGNRPAVKMSINNREAKFPDGTPNWGAKVIVSRDNLQTYFQ
jgi:cytoskeletal protein RodZ